MVQGIRVDGRDFSVEFSSGFIELGRPNNLSGNDRLKLLDEDIQVELSEICSLRNLSMTVFLMALLSKALSFDVCRCISAIMQPP